MVQQQTNRVALQRQFYNLALYNTNSGPIMDRLQLRDLETRPVGLYFACTPWMDDIGTLSMYEVQTVVEGRGALMRLRQLPNIGGEYTLENAIACHNSTQHNGQARQGKQRAKRAIYSREKAHTTNYIITVFIE